MLTVLIIYLGAGFWHSPSEAAWGACIPFWSTCVQILALRLIPAWEAAGDESSAWVPVPTQEIQTELQVPVLSGPSPGCCRHLSSNQQMKDFSLPVSLSLSAFQEKKRKERKKEKRKMTKLEFYS